MSESGRASPRAREPNRCTSATGISARIAAAIARSWVSSIAVIPLPGLDVLAGVMEAQRPSGQPARGCPPTELPIKDSLRVLLLAPLLAFPFAMGRRITPPPLPDPFLP
jgi:hypothetical protein